MTWLKLDDRFPDHPKVVGLTDAAFRVHIAGLCYCSSFLTDGFIPEAQVMRLTTSAKEADFISLVAAGLWTTAPGGYRIHDFLEFNWSRAATLEHRRKGAERKGVSRDRLARGSDVTHADASRGVSATRPVPSRSIEGPLTVASIGGAETDKQRSEEGGQERAEAEQVRKALIEGRKQLRENHPLRATEEGSEEE